MKIRFKNKGRWADRTQPGTVIDVEANQVIEVSDALAAIVMRQGAGSPPDMGSLTESDETRRPEPPDAGPQEKAEGEGKQSKSEGKRKRGKRGK